MKMDAIVLTEDERSLIEMFIDECKIKDRRRRKPCEDCKAMTECNALWQIVAFGRR